jgi:hypothetical protein
MKKVIVAVQVVLSVVISKEIKRNCHQVRAVDIKPLNRVVSNYTWSRKPCT